MILTGHTPPCIWRSGPTLQKPFPFFENGANPDARDNGGSTPLHSAILNDNREIALKKRLSYGADLHAVCKAGETPLQMAASDHLCQLTHCKKLQTVREIPLKNQLLEFATANTEAGGVHESIWRSVVVVEAGNSQGSGVALKPNLVATNCHVTDAATSPIAYTRPRIAGRTRANPIRRG